MEGVCDIDIFRWARSEERSDALRIVSDERRATRPTALRSDPEGSIAERSNGVAPSGKCRCPCGLREDKALPRHEALTMRKASPAAPLLTAPYPRATQTPSIPQTGS